MARRVSVSALVSTQTKVVTSGLEKLAEVEEVLFQKLSSISHSKENEKHSYAFPLRPGKSSIKIQIVRAFDVPRSDPGEPCLPSCKVCFNGEVLGETGVVEGANPVWYGNTEELVVCTNGKSDMKKRKVDIDMLSSGSMSFEIRCKNQIGTSDILARANLVGLDLESLCQSVDGTGVKVIEMDTVGKQPKIRTKLVIRMTSTKRLPFIYENLFEKVNMTREKLEGQWRNLHSKAADVEVDSKTTKTIAALVLDVEGAKKILKDIPHNQYKAMQGQMTAFMEDIGTISQWDVGTDGILGKKTALKVYMAEKENMFSMKSIGSLRFSLIEKVRKAVDTYKVKVTKIIMKQLQKELSEVMAQLKRERYKRKLYEQVDILKSPAFMEKAKACETTVQAAENAISSNSSIAEQTACIHNAKNEIAGLVNIFYFNLINAIFIDWEGIAVEAELLTKKKQEESAKKRHIGPSKIKDYRAETHRFQDELSRLMEQEIQQAHIQARLPVLQGIYINFVNLGKDKRSTEQLSGLLADMQEKYNAFKEQIDADDSVGRGENMVIKVRIEELRHELSFLTATESNIDAKLLELSNRKKSKRSSDRRESGASNLGSKDRRSRHSSHDRRVTSGADHRAISPRKSRGGDRKTQ